MNNELRIRRFEKWRWVFTGRQVTQIPLKALVQQQIDFELNYTGLFSYDFARAIYAAVLQRAAGAPGTDLAWRQGIPAARHAAVERIINSNGDSLVEDYKGHLKVHWRPGAEGLVDVSVYSARLQEALSEHVEALRALLAQGLGSEELLRRVEAFQNDWADQAPFDVLLTDEERALFG